MTRDLPVGNTPADTTGRKVPFIAIYRYSNISRPFRTRLGRNSHWWYLWVRATDWQARFDEWQLLGSPPAVQNRFWTDFGPFCGIAPGINEKTWDSLLAVLDSPWAVLEDCQRNEASKINDDVTMLQSLNKSNKRHFGPFCGTSPGIRERTWVLPSRF